eukprot:sb/3467723/
MKELETEHDYATKLFSQESTKRDKLIKKINYQLNKTTNMKREAFSRVEELQDQLNEYETIMTSSQPISAATTRPNTTLGARSRRLNTGDGKKLMSRPKSTGLLIYNSYHQSSVPIQWALGVSKESITLGRIFCWCRARMLFGYFLCQFQNPKFHDDARIEFKEEVKGRSLSSQCSDGKKAGDSLTERERESLLWPDSCHVMLSANPISAATTRPNTTLGARSRRLNTGDGKKLMSRPKSTGLLVKRSVIHVKVKESGRLSHRERKGVSLAPGFVSRDAVSKPATCV